MSDKPVILTGIRANNDLHIGNYFGALLPIIDIARQHSGEYQVNLFIPDLHSFTTPIDHNQLQAQILNNLKIFVAAGLPIDNPDINIYRQSYIPAHSELTWILDCFTSFGEMSRMTQFKDKSKDLQTQQNIPDADNQPSRISMGLFNYPVLMAADILLYGAEYIPVGDDQTQHLEFARNIAERMNNRFRDTFPDGLFALPRPVKEQHSFFGNDQGLRIRDLQNPTNKMSKSEETGKGIIFLDDDPEEAVKKIMSATTDSVGNIHLDWEKQPGISNLIQILALIERKPLIEVIPEWENKNSYGDLKKVLSEKVRLFLTDFQKCFHNINESDVISKLESSENIMRERANSTLFKAQQAVGLRHLNKT